MDFMKLCSFMSTWLKMRCDYQCIKLAHEAQDGEPLVWGKIISVANILRQNIDRKKIRLSCNRLLAPNQQSRLRNS